MGRSYLGFAQGRLAVSEAKYRNLVETANEAIVIIQDGKLVYANQRSAELSAFSGLDGHRKIHAALRSKVSSILAEYEAEGCDIARLLGFIAYEIVLKRMRVEERDEADNFGFLSEYLGRVSARSDGSINRVIGG